MTASRVDATGEVEREIAVTPVAKPPRRAVWLRLRGRRRRSGRDGGRSRRSTLTLEGIPGDRHAGLHPAGRCARALAQARRADPQRTAALRSFRRRSLPPSHAGSGPAGASSRNGSAPIFVVVRDTPPISSSIPRGTQLVLPVGRHARGDRPERAVPARRRGAGQRPVRRRREPRVPVRRRGQSGCAASPPMSTGRA